MHPNSGQVPRRWKDWAETTLTKTATAAIGLEKATILRGLTSGLMSDCESSTKECNPEKKEERLRELSSRYQLKKKRDKRSIVTTVAIDKSFEKKRIKRRQADSGSLFITWLSDPSPPLFLLF